MTNQEVTNKFVGQKLLGTVFKGDQMLLVFEDGAMLLEGEFRKSFANAGVIKSAVEGALEECQKIKSEEKRLKELLENFKR